MDSSFDPTQPITPAESEQLIRSSITGYGTLPDPQLVAESMNMGSTSILSSALASGDPSLQSALLSQPVGQSQYASKGLPPPTALFEDPYQYDPATAQQHLQQYDEIGIDNSFSSFKTMPMANIGWRNSVLNGSPDQVKQWQQFLASHGFYGTFDQDGKNFKPGEVNGYTSAEFQNGLDQWALAFFLPQAISSRDPTEVQHARMFLSGIGFDPDAAASQMASDPSKRVQMVDSWLQALGPDQKKQDALNAFADHFGAAALPTELNDYRKDFKFNTVGNFLSHIPGVNLIPGLNPQEFDAGLTDAEKEALQPAVQQAHDDSGFLHTVGDILGAPSKAAVTTAYFFGHALHGDVENPFDAGSTIRQQSDQFVENPSRVLFGDQFVKDHPWLATVGNIAINIADDPISYIPYVGEASIAEKLGKAALGEGVDAAEAIAKGKTMMTPVERATGGLVSHRVGTLRSQAWRAKPVSVVKSLRSGTRDTVTKALDPIGNAQQEVARMLARKGADGKSLMTTGLMRNVLGDDLESSTAKITKLMQMSKDGDHQNILAFLRDPKNGYADRLFDMSFLLNRNEYGKVLKNFDRINKGKALHIWHTAAMNDAPSVVDLNRPGEALDHARDAAMVAGMKPQDIGEFEDKLWATAAGSLERGTVWSTYNKAIAKAWGERTDSIWHKVGGVSRSGLQGAEAWRSAYGRGPFTTKPADGLLYAMEHDLGKDAVEISKRSLAVKFTKGTAQYTAEELTKLAGEYRGGMDGLTKDWQAQLDAAARKMDPHGELTDESKALALLSPEVREAQVIYQSRLMDKYQHLSQMEKDFGDAAESTPAPMLETQAFQMAHFPWTATQMMGYLNPILRKSEYIQRRLPVDRAMNLWKATVLMKPATGLRVIFGDESSRFHINLLANDPKTWLRYMHSLATNRGHASLDDMVKSMKASHPELMMSLYKLSHQGLHKFQPFEPGQAGYGEALTHAIEQHYGRSAPVKSWVRAVEKAHAQGADIEKAGVSAMQSFLRSDTEAARLLRDAKNIPDIKGDNAVLDDLARTMEYDFRTFTGVDFSDPARTKLFKWVKSGKVDDKAMQALLKKQSYAGNVLPRIQGRPPILGSQNGAVGMLSEAYHGMLNQWINRARARGFMFKTESELKRLKNFYEDGLFGADHNEILHRMAESSAARWVKRNTYQGARSASGSTLRALAPFWGATANSDKFYVRTMVEHPEVAVPTAQGLHNITEQQQKGGFHVTVPFAGQILSKLGMTAGDDFTFDPFNAFFLTREGLGGFVPGMGPVFNVGMQLAGGDFSDWVSQNIPGMQYAAQGTPMLPWLENLVAGASLATGALGGQGLAGVPLLGRQTGYYDKLIDQDFKEQEAAWLAGGRQGPEPTADSARKDVAAQRITTGVAGFSAPLGLTAQNDQQQALYDSGQEWSSTLTPDQKAQFYAKYDAVFQQQQQAWEQGGKQGPPPQNVADYYRYRDPATSETPEDGKVSKQDILARSPWVLADTTGMGQSTIPGRATASDSTEQYKLDVREGNIRTLTPTEYLTKMRTQEQVEQAWNEYDRLQFGYQQFLMATGSGANSPAAVQYRKTVLEPQVDNLANNYREWGDRFVKQTSTSLTGQSLASKPFRTVTAFDSLPQSTALETNATVLMRAAQIRLQQATSALTQIIASGGSQYEKEMVLQGLQQEMDQMAQQDPTFAGWIGQYRFRSVDDLVSSEAQMNALAQTQS